MGAANDDKKRKPKEGFTCPDSQQDSKAKINTRRSHPASYRIKHMVMENIICIRSYSFKRNMDQYMSLHYMKVHNKKGWDAKVT